MGQFGVIAPSRKLRPQIRAAVVVAPMRKWTTYVALAGAAALAAVQACAQFPGAQETDFSQAEKQFEQRCQGCHGEGGEGGDRAPALINSRSLRSRNKSQIR